MTRSLQYAYTAFFIGLAAIVWVGIGYIGSNPLALVMTLLIGAFYVMGALELRRFHAATGTLTRAVADDTTEPPASLGAWLAPVDASLRNAVRLRIEGERVGLPGPALTPYLTGLLVLLGMLGTFLGMVVTLHGTGTALESAADIQAIRASLAAPVKGLGLAFGTSLAGVAASAMLGMMSALCRRDRVQAAQGLDTRIATGLRGFSLAHQREESFKLLQRQGAAMPALVDSLQTMLATMERHSQALNERVLASQDSFHSKAELAYAGLASSVGQSLSESLRESARLSGAALQPVVDATLASIDRVAGLAQQNEALHERLLAGQETFHGKAEAVYAGLASSVGRSLSESLNESARLGGATLQPVVDATMASIDRVAHLAQQNETLHERLLASQESFHGKTELAYAALASSVGVSLNESLTDSARVASATIQPVVEATMASIARETASLHDTIGHHVQRQLDGLSARFEASTSTVADIWTAALAGQQRSSEALSTDLRGTLDQFTDTFAQRSASLVDGVATRLDSTVEQLAAHWRGALAQQERTSEQLSGDTQRALAAAADTFAQHSASLLGTVSSAHGELQTQLAARDQERLGAWTQALDGMAASLQQEWQQAGAHTARQQEAICATLAQTARDISAQTEAHASSTLSEIAGLMQAAAEAPRAAAEVIAELRQKLSDSMVRDNAMLDERSRILGTLETLLGAVNHASTEQRSAIDALVGSSADLLARVGAQFTDQVGTEAGKMAEVAAQLTGSAVEVASLGEAFGQAVQLFSDSNDKLGTQLQRIEGALGKSMARSDEQLAYYVAQAREVIELSTLSQKQIVEDLQRLAASQSNQRALAGSEA